MTIKRRQDWPEKLIEHFALRAEMPFAWGTNDCVTFSIDGVRAMTDVDPIADIRGTWTDALSAARVIKSVGGIAAATDRLYTRHSNPLMVKRGDLALVELDDREVLGICAGEYWAGPGPDGILLMPITLPVIAAWAVGDIHG